MPQPMTPSAWFAHSPLLPDEQLFVVLSSASDAGALAAWQAAATSTTTTLRSVWAQTAYAEWDEVLPYVGIVETGNGFLDWVAATEFTDWGWLAVSSSPLDTVVAHLQGMTKVLLPDGQAVFLRFWDGAQFLPMVQKLGGEAGAVLPVFQRYLINAQPLTVATTPVATAKASPWWRVPAPLLTYLAEQSPQTLIDNLLQWLEEQRPDLHAAFSPATLRHKVAYFARGADVSHEALADYLASELS
ncbi:DUF4123 domain-containing protein [Pseudomonas sp. EYE_354]|jgi:hypothetical protein|uniref:DUF4123 domain-containing protein n=1 Tax=Pseudomonas sp. EYE_354 TaxID=2853449 RepID=UPI0020059AC1|nr:DUF4123 domain-containing protein [Pseudomonas sp. EYE_354]MCK6187162.1 DUF4123 domain-containing protein [Pseudomonas sp. EYE_354]